MPSAFVRILAPTQPCITQISALSLSLLQRLTDPCKVHVCLQDHRTIGEYNPLIDPFLVDRMPIFAVV